MNSKRKNVTMIEHLAHRAHRIGWRKVAADIVTGMYTGAQARKAWTCLVIAVVALILVQIVVVRVASWLSA